MEKVQKIVGGHYSTFTYLGKVAETLQNLEERTYAWGSNWDDDEVDGIVIAFQYIKKHPTSLFSEAVLKNLDYDIVLLHVALVKTYSRLVYFLKGFEVNVSEVKMSLEVQGHPFEIYMSPNEMQWSGDLAMLRGDLELSQLLTDLSEDIKKLQYMYWNILKS